MEQLSGMDASFLYMETPRTPMHIGGLYLFDPNTSETEFSYARFREHIAARLHVSRTFRQRLVELPLHLGHPYWIEDPDFDLDQHLPRITLPEGGGIEDLVKLAEATWSQLLDRARPLWELVFVEGLDTVPELPKGCFGMISRVHHAAIDGGSGAEILGALFDPSPKPRDLPETTPWQPEEIPTSAELLARSYGKAVSKTWSLTKFVGKTALGSAKVLASAGLRKMDPPTVPFSAPSSVLNVPVTTERHFGYRIWPLKRIKAIKKAIEGATVNDAILAVCAGALRSYLEGREKLPGKPLVAMVPVSVRTDKEKGQMGNKVSAMLVRLATDHDDAVERMVRIHDGATSSKVYNNAVSGAEIMNFIPSETAALAGRLYTRMRVAGKHRPFFNLVITNVPGPPVPLYLAGAKMLISTGTAPVFDGLGLILVVTSYAGSISVSATACAEVVPDMDHLLGCLDQSLTDLETGIETVDHKIITKSAELRAKTEADGVDDDWSRTRDRLDVALGKIEKMVAKKEQAARASSEPKP